MKVEFTKEQLANPANVSILVKMIGDAAKAGFMSVKGFIAKGNHGEVQDTVYCKGISYPNAVANSLCQLEELESDDNLTVDVVRGTWQDGSGNINPTNRRSKKFPVYATIRETYNRESGEMTAALSKLRQSLTNPRPATKEYTSLGNGVYSDDAGKVYVRDLRVVSKKIVKAGEWPQKAQGAVTAIVAKLKQDMPVGNYRMFNLDGQFDSIVLGGNEIVQVVPDRELESVKTESGKEKIEA